MTGPASTPRRCPAPRARRNRRAVRAGCARSAGLRTCPPGRRRGCTTSPAGSAAGASARCCACAVHHAERIPGPGPVVLVANHSAFVDGPLLFGLIGRRLVFLAKQEMFRGPLASLLPRLGQLPVRRGAADPAPLRAAVGVLRGGGLVGVFPEGTRGAVDVAAAQHGAAWLARAPARRCCRSSSAAPGVPPACTPVPAAGGRARRRASRPVGPRRRPGRTDRRHRDRPCRLAGLVVELDRGTEQHVSSPDDVAHMTRLGLDPGEFAADVTSSTPADDERRSPRRRSSPSSAGRTSASRRWSTACSAAARPWCRTSPASPATASPTTRCGTGAGSPSSTPAAGSPTPRACRPPVAAQAELAMRTADAVLLVVDASVGATATDEAVARVLRRSDRPGPARRHQGRRRPAHGRRRRAVALGLGEPYPVSGLHGRGSGDLLDAVLAALPESPRDTFGAGTAARAASRWSASRTSASPACSTGCRGRPARWSHDVAGTTVDPVDSLVELDGEIWRFVDTAGLRKRVNTASGMEYYASLRTRAAIEAAEVAVVLLDASRADRRAGPAGDRHGRGGRPGAGAGVQQVGPRRRGPAAARSKRELERDLVARAVGRAGQRLGADRPGRRQDRPGAAHRAGVVGHPDPDRPAQRLAVGRRRRDARRRCAAASSPRSSSRPRPQTRPPTFVLFTSGFLEAGYRRFLERRLREEFGFTGSPIRLSVRVREKRARKG